MDKILRLIKKIIPSIYKERLKLRFTKVLFWKRKAAIKKIYRVSLNGKMNENIDQIIFLVFDCMRKNNLSLYGYKRDTTPFLNDVAQHAAVFNNAISSSNWTCPSVISILSGLYPHNHGGTFSVKDSAISNALLPIQPQETIIQLQDILLQCGFDTYFLTSILTSSFPLEGTFNHHEVIQKDAAYLTNRLKGLMKKRKKKFFYVHFGDLHEPIKAPMKYRDRFGKVMDIPNLESWGSFHKCASSDEEFLEFKKNKIKLYDATIYYMDKCIKNLFTFLKREDLLKSSVLIITADHGEGFWEHKELDLQYFFNPKNHYGCAHANNLFQETISVPLIIYGNEIKKGRFNNRVSLIDIYPTLLNSLAINVPEGIDGKNLFIRNEERFLLVESSAYGLEKKAVFYKDYKLHFSKYDNVEIAFNLRKDPKECFPLKDENIPDIKKMRKFLHSIKESKCSHTLEADEETKKKLQQLGYF